MNDFLIGAGAAVLILLGVELFRRWSGHFWGSGGGDPLRLVVRPEGPAACEAAVRSVLARARWLETPWELWCVLQEDDLPSWEIARRLAADFPTVRPVGEAQLMELLRK